MSEPHGYIAARGDEAPYARAPGLLSASRHLAEPGPVVVWARFASHYLNSFFEALRGAGVEVHVRYWDPQFAGSRAPQGWVPQPLGPGESCVKGWRSALKATPRWRESVHVVPGYGHPRLLALALMLCREGVDWVHWSEASHPGWRWWLGYPVKRCYAGLVRRYGLGALAQGKMAAADFLRWGIPRDRIAMLTYAVGPPSPSCPGPPAGIRNLQGSCRLMLFVGALSARKGVDLLLYAYSGLPRQLRAGWVLCFVGLDQTRGQSARLAASLGLEDDVYFLGPVRCDEIPAVLKCGSVLVLPSRFDGWGVVLNEGAAAGLALVASESVGAAHHLIVPGVNGFRVRTGNVGELRQALAAYLAEPDLALQHGRESRRIVADYSPARQAERFVAAVHQFRSRRLGHRRGA